MSTAMTIRTAAAACGPAVVLAAVLCAPAAVRADDGAPKGVNPKDVVTKVDVIARRDAFDGGTTLDSLTLKYDRGLNENWALAVEVPLARFDSPFLTESGLAESKVKLRRVANRPWGAWLAGGEFVVPTDTRRSLGSGKWQVNPSVGAVVSITPNVFVFGGYQHFFSVAGRSDAATINQSQPRVIVARTSPAGWWLMSDVKLTFDHETSARTLDTEFEAGRMLGREWGVSMRLIGSGLDSTRKWGAVAVVRHMF